MQRVVLAPNRAGEAWAGGSSWTDSWTDDHGMSDVDRVPTTARLRRPSPAWLSSSSGTRCWWTPAGRRRTRLVGVPRASAIGRCVPELPRWAHRRDCCRQSPLPRTRPRQERTVETRDRTPNPRIKKIAGRGRTAWLSLVRLSPHLSPMHKLYLDSAAVTEPVTLGPQWSDCRRRPGLAPRASQV